MAVTLNLFKAMCQKLQGKLSALALGAQLFHMPQALRPLLGYFICP
jgi:hypothetical protein